MLYMLNALLVAGIWMLNLPSLQMDLAGRIPGSANMRNAFIITGLVGGIARWLQIAFAVYVFYLYGIATGVAFLIVTMLVAGAFRYVLQRVVLGFRSRTRTYIILTCLALGLPVTLIAGFAIVRHVGLV
jgi:hypothetical protein